MMRRVLCLILASVTGALLAADAPPRATPARPSKPAPSRVESATSSKTITLQEVAAKLGLKFSWTQTGVKAVLSDAKRRAEFELESRETSINGLRVFLGTPVTSKSGRLLVSVTDYEGCLVPLLQPSLALGRRPRPKVIAIDAGHGGVDQGTENRRLEFKEKTFTLDVAKRLQGLLEKQGFTVVMTRSSDVTVDKPMRVIIANRASADLFLSIHFNALPNDRKTRGTEVFTFAPQFQRSTNSWSPLEPDDTEREGSLGNRFDAWNALFAHTLHRELLSQLKTFDRGKKIAHLGVLRGLNCPGVLVESGFLSNDEEAKKIATPSYRQEIAAALASGIVAYADQVEALGRKS